MGLDEDREPDDQDVRVTSVFPVAAQWDWTLETEDGYQVGGNLRLGAVSRADEAPLLSDAAAPGIDQHCGDPDTDAYIPAALTLTNQTSDFDHRLFNHFHLATTEGAGVLLHSAPDGLLMAAPLFASGVECRDVSTADDAFFSGGRGWSVSFSEPAAPGESRGPHLAYLVLPGYYTPANPEGDVDRLDAVGLAIVAAMRSDDARLTSFTGPGVDHGEDGGAFLLSALREDDGGAADEGACPAPEEGSTASRPAFDGYPEMGIDRDRTYLATVETSCGELVLQLDAAGAPLATNSFVALARAGFYDGTVFHRVIDDFMIQGGDPMGDGSGGPGYTFEDELATAEGLVQAQGGYPRGTLAMANAGPDSNGSQFFIVVGDPAPLDADHTVFGEVIAGGPVTDRIAQGPADGDRPTEPVRIESIDIEES